MRGKLAAVLLLPLLALALFSGWTLYRELAAQRDLNRLDWAYTGVQYGLRLVDGMLNASPEDQEARWRALDSLLAQPLAQDAGGRDHAARLRREDFDQLRAGADPETRLRVLRGWLGWVDGVARHAPDSTLARHLETLTVLTEAGLRLALVSGAGRHDPALLLLLERFETEAPEGIVADWRRRSQCDSGSACWPAALRETQRLYAGYIAESIEQRHAEGRRDLFLLILLTLLPIIPTVLLILRVNRDVTGGARALLAAMRAIADGRFDAPLPPPRGDEFGQLAEGLAALRGQLADRTREQAALLERERREAAEIQRRVEEIEAFARRVAAGDLSARLRGSEDALGQLAVSLNAMVGGLAVLAGRVADASEALIVTSAQVQGASSAQSAGAAQQAAAVTETMTTLEELRVTANQNLNKARQLGDIAERARSEGEEGLRGVEASITGMNEISARVETIAHSILALNGWTQRIGEITAAVHDIARQLRLLSLNAAVEATKAGDSGRGFAVVASEVKQLAEQSQDATRQVQHILQEIRLATDRAVMATEDGSKGVDQGRRLVEQAGEAIRRLEEVVRDTSVASRQIVAAVRQEVTGIEQIATSMGDIHSVTSQYLDATQQSRAAADDLGRLAERLNSAAGAYRL